MSLQHSLLQTKGVLVICFICQKCLQGVESGFRCFFLLIDPLLASQEVHVPTSTIDCVSESYKADHSFEDGEAHRTRRDKLITKKNKVEI